MLSHHYKGGQMIHTLHLRSYQRHGQRCITVHFLALRHDYGTLYLKQSKTLVPF